MSELLISLKSSMKDAMRAKQKVRLDAIRAVLSAIKQIEVDERVEVDDTRILAILDKQVKQRRDSISQYEAGGRPELAAIEQEEIEALQEFLPQALTADEIEQSVTAAISQSGAETMRDMGKVMAILKPQMQGRADMSEVSKLIKAKLN
jgi:uncharacterized protein